MTQEDQSAEPRAPLLSQAQDRRAWPRFIRNPITESAAAFNAATRRPENSFFGCPHHKHDALATVTGLPHAEQTFTCRIEVFFPEEGRD